MTKKSKVCQYELLLLGDDKVKKLINGIENFLGSESIKEIAEKDWKPAYKINRLPVGNYSLINFAAPREKIPVLEKDFLQPATKIFFFRYNLINLTDEKKNVEQN